MGILRSPSFVKRRGSFEHRLIVHLCGNIRILGNRPSYPPAVQHQVIVVFFGDHIFLFNERVPLEDGKGISNAGYECVRALVPSPRGCSETPSRVGDDLFDQIEFDVTLFAVTTSPTRTKKDAIPADWISLI
jgi:hypothetical protein